MAAAATSLTEQRYLGDSGSKVVHDLYHEDPTPRGCRAFDLLRSGAAVRFEPDSLRQARSEGYGTCEKCFLGLERRRTSVTRELIEGP
jgi:hypothetical protein